MLNKATKKVNTTQKKIIKVHEVFIPSRNGPDDLPETIQKMEFSI